MFKVRNYWFTFLFLLPFTFCYSRDNDLIVENVLSNMTLDEKIGQLFMVATVADPKHWDSSSFGIDPNSYQQVNKKYINHLIEKYHIGGIIFQRISTPGALNRAINHYQVFNKRHNQIPLLIGQDLEWGLSMRMTDVVRFPHNMPLGAIQDNDLICAMGKEIARQCKILGVHINFSPVVDINTNPANPIIGDRSFGEDKDNVVQKATAMMKGLQDSGIIACAKHFPGHGDTSKDSHKMLPTVEHNNVRLNSVELYPFRKLIKNGIQAIMTAHLDVPALDSERCASSLSHKIVKKLLQEKYKFNGLTITDGLDMKGVAQDKPLGFVELQALRAGNDILLCPKHIPEAITLIKKALIDGGLSEFELDNHVRKIVRAKLDAMGVFEKFSHVQISPSNLSARLNTKKAQALKKKLYYSSITLVKNEGVLPLNKDNSMAYIQIGGKQDSKFLRKIKSYSSPICYHLSANVAKNEVAKIIQRIDKNTPVVVGIMGMNRFASRNYGVSSSMTEAIKIIRKHHNNVVFVLFGIPYALKWFGDISTTIIAYEDDEDAQNAAADVLVGRHNPTGSLPVSVSCDLKIGSGSSFS